MSAQDQVEDEIDYSEREPAPDQTEDVFKTDGLERVRVGEPLHWELVEFLEDEATCLDDNELIAWFQNMAPDLLYRMPVRMTKDRADGSEFSTGMFHFDENYLSLATKVTRLAATTSAWAEKPPSRTRRFITNIKVFKRDEAAGEYEVRSSMLLMRNRYQASELELLSVRRTDVIRRTEEGWKIAERMIYPDQATMGTQNLAVFL